MERELLALKARKIELEASLREKDISIERLERDLRWLNETEREAKEAKEKVEQDADAERARLYILSQISRCGLIMPLA
jgi:mitotic spindle assembly checkpoint protein MAD1